MSGDSELVADIAEGEGAERLGQAAESVAASIGAAIVNLAALKLAVAQLSDAFKPILARFGSRP